MVSLRRSRKYGVRSPRRCASTPLNTAPCVTTSTASSSPNRIQPRADADREVVVGLAAELLKSPATPTTAARKNAG